MVLRLMLDVQPKSPNCPRSLDSSEREREALLSSVVPQACRLRSVGRSLQRKFSNTQREVGAKVRASATPHPLSIFTL